MPLGSVFNDGNLSTNMSPPVLLEFEPRFGWWHIWLMVVVLGVFILSVIVGNGFVVAAILREKNLQNVSNYLVLSLAVADLLVGCLVMPLSAVSEVSSKWWLGVTLCDLYVCLDLFCCSASILHLVMIALDRYWAVTNVNYIHRRSSVRVSLLIGCVWVLSIFISIPSRFLDREKVVSRLLQEGLCVVNDSYGFTIFSTVGSFYMPMLLLCLIYLRIYFVARQRIRKKPFNKAAKTKKIKKKKLHKTLVTAALHPHLVPAQSSLMKVNRIADNSSFNQSNNCLPKQTCQPTTHNAMTVNKPVKFFTEARWFHLISAERKYSPTNQIVTQTIYDAGHSYELLSKFTPSSPPAIGFPPTEGTVLVENDHNPAVPLFNSLISVNIWADTALIPYADQESSETENHHLMEVTAEVIGNRGALIHASATTMEMSIDHTQWLFPATAPPSPPPPSPPRPMNISHPVAPSPKASPVHFSPPKDPPMSPFSNQTKSANHPTRWPSDDDEHDESSTCMSHHYEPISPITATPAPSALTECYPTRVCMEREKLGHRRERKAARTLAIITGCFLLCWIPFFILTLLRPFVPGGTIPGLLDSGALWLGYVNSLLNPIIYTIFSPDFRNAFRKILFGRYHRQKRVRRKG